MTGKNHMQQYYLTEIQTQDGLLHQGIFYQPQKSGRKALLYVHGLTSAFYHGLPLFAELVKRCEETGIGFTAFNNRGHDVITGIKKTDPEKPGEYTRMNGGAGYEHFEECIYDIDAGISFLVEQGFPDVIILGHSTGANKVCYYAGKKNDDPRVAGVILASAVSDRLDPSMGMEKLKRHLAKANLLAGKGKGEKLIWGFHAFPATYNRFISSFGPHSEEDVFDYGDREPKLTLFSKITKPLLLIEALHDEYLDRPVEKVKAVFDGKRKSDHYRSIIIDSDHGYHGKEAEVAEKIMEFVASII